MDELYLSESKSFNSLKFKEILEGKHDEIPEGMFLNAGTIEEVVERFAARNK